MALKEKLVLRAKKLKTDIPTVFLCMRHPQTPWYAKALAFATVAYALSPVDLIPDFIPVLGFLDDVLLLPMMVALCVRLIPKPVLEESREKAASLWQSGRPHKWYYALPVVLVWLMVLYLALKAFGVFR